MSRLIAVLLLFILAAPALAQDDAPTLDPETLTARELARLPLLAGPLRTSAYLSPDGENVMHLEGWTFCLYSILGVEAGCADMVERLGEDARSVRIDPDSVAWSPDGQYIAFTSDVWYSLRDSDIWVLDVDSGLFINATNDRYDGGIIIGDNIPDTAFIDVAPAWLPDARLTFARLPANGESSVPSLWEMTPGEWSAEKVADLLPENTFRNYVFAMDWSPDGSTLAYVIEGGSSADAGLWLYDAATGATRQLIQKPARVASFLRVTFSPDGGSILLLTSLRDEQSVNAEGENRETGYFVISVETGEDTTLTAEGIVSSAGWLPGGGLVYTARDTSDEIAGGLYVASAADAPARKVLDFPTHEGDVVPFYAPTSEQRLPLIVRPNGRLLLATPTLLMPIIQFEEN